jgi:hypothetical protein
MVIPFLTDSIANKIEELAAESIAIYGTTAFWTIHPDYFNSPKFLNILSQQKSFFIIDISEPTIVENVIAYTNEGANIYIYLKRAKDKLYKYNHLLHSKIILFEHKNDDFTLVIGSANMTSRAIKGTNKEAGVQINLTKSDVLLGEVKDYLNGIKRNSVKVDPSKQDLYKFIQNQENLNDLYENCPLLYLAAQNEEYNKMTRGTIIQLLGMNDKIHHFYSKVESHNQRIALLIENIDTNDSIVCVCSLKSIGEVDLNNPETYQKDYDERLLFYIGLTTFNGACTPSFVFPAMKIQKQMFYFADFHAELVIDEMYSNIYLNEFSIKGLINPWIVKETITSYGDYPLDQNFNNLHKDSIANSKSKKLDIKIQIEEIKNDCFKEGYYQTISEELTPSKLKLEKFDSPHFHKEYLSVIREINNWICGTDLNTEDRETTKTKIDEELVGIYNSLKNANRTIQKNIRLLKPSLVHEHDRIK